MYRSAGTAPAGTDAATTGPTVQQQYRYTDIQLQVPCHVVKGAGIDNIGIRYRNIGGTN